MPQYIRDRQTDDRWTNGQTDRRQPRQKADL